MSLPGEQDSVDCRGCGRRVFVVFLRAPEPALPPKHGRRARQSAPPGSVLLRVSEAADSLRVSIPTVRRLMATGRLPRLWVGQLLRVRRADVEGLVEGLLNASRGVAGPFESIHGPPRYGGGPDASTDEARAAFRQLRRDRERARRGGDGAAPPKLMPGSA